MKYVRELTDPELVTLECAYKNHAVARVRITQVRRNRSQESKKRPFWAMGYLSSACNY